jgi:hypothetical protein
MPRSATAVAAPSVVDWSAAIAERAYFKAERRGFAPGYELEDWLAAEREVAALLAAPAAKPKRKITRAKSGAEKAPAAKTAAARASATKASMAKTAVAKTPAAKSPAARPK